MNKIVKMISIMLAGASILVLPSLAHADNNLSLKLEPGIAVPLTSPQSNRFDAGGAVAVTGLIAPTPWFAFGPTLSMVALSSNLDGIDTGAAWGGGLSALVRRSHNNQDHGLEANSPWLGTDFQMVKTGDLLRPVVSVGAGIEFPTDNNRDLWVGPFARFENLFPTSSDLNLDKRDAKLLVVGLTFEFEGSHQMAAPVSVSDRDHDGVVDSVDYCPDVPGPKSNNGCPYPVVQPVAPSNKVNNKPVQPATELKHKVQFAYDSSVLQNNSIATLNEVVKSLSENVNYHVVIEGHASSEGTVSHNQTLSVQRAQAVANYLVNHGIDNNRLSVVGFGSSRPITTNSTKADREINRRVEVNVTLTLEENK